MSNWTGRIQPSDFEYDQDYHKRLQRDFQDVFDALRRVRNELERSTQPQPTKRVEYLLTDTVELVEYLQKTVAELQERTAAMLELVPKLLAERDRLLEESEHSQGEMEYLNWLLEMGLADSPDHIDATDNDD